MGERYGPLVVSHEAWATQDVRGRKVAVPGTMTTAYLALRLYQPDFLPVVMQFDQIMEAVGRKEVDAGLLIHEGQLTYARAGLHKVIDLGEWWHDRTRLPLPLGGNGIRRDLGHKRMREISRLIRESIQYALVHRKEALEHALKYARGLSSRDADKFVSMYVNSRTLDCGEDGRRAVRLLLEEAYANGLIPMHVQVDFAE
jgi:1,4-dihydroxy-6-naphthoate synthase